MPEAPNFTPVRVLEAELSQPLRAIPACNPATGQRYTRARVLVRLHSHPLGIVEVQLDDTGLSADICARQIWRALHGEINDQLRRDGLPPLVELTADGVRSIGQLVCREVRDRARAQEPFVSIVVPSRDRPQDVAGCIAALVALDYPNYEIIVVDNAPSDQATLDVVRGLYGDLPHVRYIREDWPGAARARNRGLMEAKAEIVAFTDDDVRVDPHWLTGLVKGFSAAEGVACVTGIILPIELETPSQMWFEQFGGFSKGFAERIYDLAEHRPPGKLYSYTAGMFGASANMAVKASVLRELGGFDTALGLGTPASGGGEDLDVYFKVITRGYKLVYEPEALVYHMHRREYAALAQQMYGYGAGLTAFLMKCLVDDPRRIVDLLKRFGDGMFFALSPRSPKNSKKPADYPKQLTYMELKGMLYGPFAYLLSRRRVRKLRRTQSYAIGALGSADRVRS